MRVKDIKIGGTYNGVKVVAKIYKGKSSFLCICPICKKEYALSAAVIGKRKSCIDCYSQSKFKDLSGKKFGELTVIGYVGFRNKKTYWRCLCDCGAVTEVRTCALTSGRTQTCGHACGKQRKSVSSNFEFNKPLHEHPLWRIWDGIKQRCENTNSPSYSNYGARGIKICDRWQGERGFENFVNDMGERPSSKHSIDRIDVNGDYCPENCRWATQKEQCNNQRKNILIECNGKEITLTQLCEILGLNRKPMYSKIKKGVDINFLVMNSDKYRVSKTPQRYTGHINHNRVVSEEVMKLLENINTNSDE